MMPASALPAAKEYEKETFTMSIKTLVINPGSTSTKIGVFEDETLLFEETLRHPTEEIAKYASVIDQKDFRKEIILDFLKEKNCDPKTSTSSWAAAVCSNRSPAAPTPSVMPCWLT